jgi:K+-sensing histidine kinase KdpD
MPDSGKLTIETSNAHLDDNYAAQHIDVPPGQYVLIAITDTGTGMAREQIGKAFEPFYTTKGSGRGTGLGLAQCMALPSNPAVTRGSIQSPGMGRRRSCACRAIPAQKKRSLYRLARPFL